MATASHLEKMEKAEVPSCLRLQQPQNTPLRSLLVRHVPIKCSYYKNCLKVYRSLHYYFDAVFKNYYKKICPLIEIKQVPT